MNRITELIKGAVMLIDGRCTEDMINETAHNLNYYNPRDYFTADRACKYLRVSRDTFYKTIVPKYNLTNYKFNNVSIGFYLTELKEIKKDLENHK